MQKAFAVEPQKKIRYSFFPLLWLFELTAYFKLFKKQLNYKYKEIFFQLIHIKCELFKDLKENTFKIRMCSFENRAKNLAMQAKTLRHF